MLESLEIFSISDLFLLGAFGLSLVLVCNCALQLVLGKQRTPLWVETVFGGAALVALGVLVVDAIHWFDGQTGSDLQPLVGLTIIVLAMATAWLYLRCAALRTTPYELRRRPAVWLLLVSLVAMASWSSYRFQCAVAPEMNLPPLSVRPLLMQRETHYVGVSDKGREIPLYRSAAKPLPSSQTYRPASDPQGRVDNTVIVRGEPDSSSNCHGWVFTGGEFLLDIQGIKTILEDNGYRPCTSPQPGDVIIYYLSGDVVAHAGLVSGVLHDGTVLIESKWGIEGRYLHRPEDQPYSETFAYYRSSRDGNEITIREVPSDSLVKQRLPRKRLKRA
jgi:hypothetical protein